MELNTIYYEDCLTGMQKHLPDESIDLTVTSPPYDNLRNYHSEFDFQGIAKELFRVTKKGGVVVWVVGDSVIKGSESLTSFKQAIYFVEECGFSLHDTMIFGKKNPPPVPQPRYQPKFEYMFVLSKGKPKTFNPIRVPTKHAGKVMKSRTFHTGGGPLSVFSTIQPVKDSKIKGNIWEYDVGYQKSTKDSYAFAHPATFPESLAHDHIISWSNPGDLILDPFIGAGTTAKIAKQLGRNYIGFEVNPEYKSIIDKRLGLT